MKYLVLEKGKSYHVQQYELPGRYHDQWNKTLYDTTYMVNLKQSNP